MRPALFIDRDGTLIEDKDYLKNPQDIVWVPGAIEALKRAKDAGYALVMVTNQSGVGRGYFTLEGVNLVHQAMVASMQVRGVDFDDIYVAPEAPDAPSRYRKPNPQALFDAALKHDLDLNRSFMIGDKLDDVMCGWNAHVSPVLVRTGKGKCQHVPHGTLGFDDLPQTVDWILRVLGNPL